VEGDRLLYITGRKGMVFDKLEFHFNNCWMCPLLIGVTNNWITTMEWEFQCVIWMYEPKVCLNMWKHLSLALFDVAYIYQYELFKAVMLTAISFIDVTE
jgi:hypothetical protein